MPSDLEFEPPSPTPASDRPQRRGRERERARLILRRRLLACAVLVALGGALAVLIAASGSTPRAAALHRSHGTAARHSQQARRPLSGFPTTAPQSSAGAPFAVRLVVKRFVDRTRFVRLPNGVTVPRTLDTYVWYPALGPSANRDLLNASATPRTPGSFPLIVFGHGFAETPKLYAPLLRAWASKGYVVAAPVFPLANANAPGGPDESDLPNQPADMRTVISRMLSAGNSSTPPLNGLVNARQIAVAGHSDGGDSALAIAFDPRFRDPRVRAAIILSGAEIPGIGSFRIAPGGPPLLATQGTSDVMNLPSSTHDFYDSAPAPKYLLELPGASHVPPYSSEQPQLGVVERVTIAFLDDYLRHLPGSSSRLLAAGSRPGVATLSYLRR